MRGSGAAAFPLLTARGLALGHGVGPLALPEVEQRGPGLGILRLWNLIALFFLPLVVEELDEVEALAGEVWFRVQSANQTPCLYCSLIEWMAQEKPPLLIYH